MAAPASRAPSAAPAGARAGSERVPPHSEEAERGVLGSALLDADRVLDLCVTRGLTPDSFYVPAHRVLFEKLLEMQNEQRPVDLITVNERLRDLGRVEEIGGAAYLERLVDSTPTAAHAEYYVGLVASKAILRSIIVRATESIESCYAAEDDAAEVLSRAEQGILAISDSMREDVAAWPQLVKDGFGGIEHILQNPGDLTGLSTGYRDLDRVLFGLQRGDMIVLAARPSMGKTSLAMNIAEHVATGANPTTGYGGGAPKPVAIFSLEMSRESLVRRMICARARVHFRRITEGFVSAEEHTALTQAVDALMKAQILLDDTAGLDALELRARARRLKKNHDVQLIVVDYLQMLNYRQFAREGRQRETQAISGAMKAMAKELNVPVLVLSQLSRAPEQRDKSAIPRLSDLRDSGSIEQDADVVLLLRRPSRVKEDPRNDDKLLAIVDVAKQRNGPTRVVEMNFDEDVTRFDDRKKSGTDADAFGNEPSAGEVDE